MINGVFTLILTLAMGVEGGSSMITVRFADQASCMTAAQLWLNNSEPNDKPSRYGYRRSAICVPSL